MRQTFFIFLFLPVLIFLTSCEKKKDLLIDGDGNVYKTINIGSQEWLTENLKTTKYNDGTPITLITEGNEWSLTTAGAYCWYDNDSAAYAKPYGPLYNWYAVGTDSLCPAGWHVATNDDLTVLTEYLENNGFGYQGSGNDIGKAMASVSGWNIDPTSGNVGNDQGSNNSSGFSILPGGYRSFIGTFISKESGGFWWSKTEFSEVNAYARALRSYIDGVYYYYNTKKNGYSVRCLKD